MTASSIPGYRYHDVGLPPARLSATDLDNLCASVLLDDDDRQALRDARAAVEPRVEELLDVWYGFVGSHPFLLDAFSTASGPDSDYLARVRARFGQWVLDTLDANFDTAWLAWQAEIGRRHAATKNQADGVVGTPACVPFRYVAALVVPIYATMRPFLEPAARDAGHLERMHAAWLKAVVLSVALWSEAYVPAPMY